jgi:hypothetical protein
MERRRRRRRTPSPFEPKERKEGVPGVSQNFDLPYPQMLGVDKM